MERLQLSDIDRRIVTALSQFGRLPYKDLAAEVGIPTSTCHGRVRALEERGVIRGYRAEIAPEAVGQAVSALIMLRVHAHQRDLVPMLTKDLRSIPGVQQLFLIGGDKDLVVHVACSSVQALRSLISEHLGSNAALAQTQTQLVFEHLVGLTPLALDQPSTPAPAPENLSLYPPVHRSRSLGDEGRVGTTKRARSKEST